MYGAFDGQTLAGIYNLNLHHVSVQGERVVAAPRRGDRQINETKLAQAMPYIDQAFTIADTPVPAPTPIVARIIG